ncbi:DUF590-domain-containing protein [Aaosphaeria arxii CBS 175.79]|uniref:DUF590-domain-containing protein n=1 Tax=Aaosphaeria arxii CBS 175.79 TaxID=1450172 RepID=A0A6A5Y8I5_9PLEO|nr:DUF590-domain-containing protein [Aaosphaeria arxii CBS 175.79]KAF2021061.1 DUF590-domain-containing protein [Aaosphaeria arxii CBS 175.79]
MGIPRLQKVRTFAFGVQGEKNLPCNDKYIIVYDFSEAETDEAIKEFSTLLEDVKSVGLHTEVRAGYNQTLLVFVQAPRELLGNTVYRSRVKDWLYGITKQHPGGNRDTVVDGDFEAEDILSMYHLVNWRKELGGAGITPEFGKWKNVKSIFPLHNISANEDLLYHLSKKLLLSAEDLDRIRDLWGAKVAFYFAFLQTYFVFLIIPCVAGIFAWQFLPQYSLSFAFIIGFWCTVFLEYWKIQETDLSIRWKVRGVGGLKVNRPQFQYEKEFVDAAGRVQQFFPRWKQIARQSVVIPFVLLSLLLLGILIVVVFAIEIYISEAYEGPYKFYLEYLPTVLLAILLPYIGNTLEDIASTMTEFENHRTQDNYEMSLTQKIFVLNSITNYLPILLTAFVYVPFGDILVPQLQNNLHKTFGASIGKFDFKSDADRLRNEVIALTVTGQISNLGEELVFPYLKTRFREWWREHQAKNADADNLLEDDPSETKTLKRARKQALLSPYNVQDDISEMVIQFGYLALFSPVWPLIPIGFLINNWIELRSDFLKICIEHQRPTPVRGDGIGPWITSLEALTWLGSVSSAAIVHLFGQHHYAMGIMQTTMGKWCSLPLTIFVSEHIFLAFRAAVRFSLQKIGSRQIRKERNERYAERKKYLDELESSTTKSGHLDVVERERRKSVRMTSEDVFWTRQAEEGVSNEVGIGLIRAAKQKEEQGRGITKVD